jgi:hypothetical protein
MTPEYVIAIILIGAIFVMAIIISNNDRRLK